MGGKRQRADKGSGVIEGGKEKEGEDGKCRRRTINLEPKSWRIIEWTFFSLCCPPRKLPASTLDAVKARVSGKVSCRHVRGCWRLTQKLGKVIVAGKVSCYMRMIAWESECAH